MVGTKYMICPVDSIPTLLCLPAGPIRESSVRPSQFSISLLLLDKTRKFHRYNHTATFILL